MWPFLSIDAVQYVSQNFNHPLLLMAFLFPVSSRVSAPQGGRPRVGKG